MTATQTAIDPRTVDAVYAEFISQARGEEYPFPPLAEYTTAMLKADVLGEPAMYEKTWRGAKRVIEAIEQIRGLTPEQQFEKGIVSMLSKVEALLISFEMRQQFGLETMSRIPHFNRKGEFQVSPKHDLIIPIRKDGLIHKLNFYTIAEMKKW